MSVVHTLGYPGIALVTCLENVIPPIPSELVMPLAGFIASRDDLTFWGVVAAGTAGSLAGATAWYVVGRRVGEARVRAFFRRRGRWAGLSETDIDRAMDWFRRHGAIAVLIGRLLPAVRTFISLPAGFAGMSLVPFLAYSLVGTAAWIAALTWAGMVLGENHQAVDRYLDPATWAVLAGVVGWYVYKVVTYDATGDEEGSRE